jgi:hypothetical protein
VSRVGEAYDAPSEGQSEIPAKEKNMEKHDVTHLETQTNELIANLVKLADDNDLKQFLKTIHHPGFTTPAELFLFRGVVDSMLAQTKALSSLRQVLTSAAAKVELNPQPLPPKQAAEGAT